MFSPDQQIPTFEKEIETKAILHFMRHGKREKGATREEDLHYDLRLTEQGRKQSDEKGKRVNPHAEVAVGLGSSRTRSQETAYRVMLANEGIVPEDSFEDIEKKVAENLKYGKKMIVDDRLNFSSEGPIGKDLDKAYEEGRYMPWVINESDRKAIEMGDNISSTYTRMAGNAAEIVARYLKIGENFNRVVSKKEDRSEYEELGNTMERYPGTHMGVSESFVAKVIEKKLGKEKKDEFLQEVGGGFGETEGIRVEIINKGQASKVYLYFEVGGQEDRVEIDDQLLQDVISERGEFEKMVEETIRKNEAV